MYAIVRIGGRQYHAELGTTIVVENLPYEVGHQMDFNEILLLSDGENTFIGQPFVEGASIAVEVVEQFKGKKIVVFKYKPKIHYRRKQGHRQNYTRLLVHRIGDEGSQPAEKKARSAKKAAVSKEVVIETELREPVAKKPRATKKSAEAKSSGEGSKPAAKKTRSAKKAETNEEA
jgi:large subunit ribosomal protein L21